MSEQRQPNASSTDRPARQDAETQNVGGANLGETTATQKNATREETIAELKAEFPSFQPSEFVRDLDENDPEWQRTGGAPGE